MFWNIYSKRLLSCLRNKDQLIWIWAFPLILATLFYFTLSSVGEADNLKRTPCSARCLIRWAAGRMRFLT